MSLPPFVAGAGLEAPEFEVPFAALPQRAQWDGWDELERVDYAHRLRDDDEQLDMPMPVGEGIVARALLAELQRPPWWRDVDRERRAIREELA